MTSIRFLTICLVFLCVAGNSCDRSSTETESARQAGSYEAIYDGKRVRYFDSGGEGRPLVLVHGWASDIFVWEKQIDGFGFPARVLAVDLPGHGKSELPSQEFSMNLFARAIAAVMDDADVERAVLIGHSNGTPAIRQFFRLFPERTEALIGVDGALKNAFGDAATTQKVEKQMTEQFSPEGYCEALKGMFASMPAERLDADARVQLSAMACRQPHATVQGGITAAFDLKIWDPDPIEVPMLLVLAPQPSWSEEYLSFVKELAPQVEIRMVEGAGHFIMFERPDEFSGLVAEFLRKTDLLRTR